MLLICVLNVFIGMPDSGSEDGNLLRRVVMKICTTAERIYDITQCCDIINMWKTMVCLQLSYREVGLEHRRGSDSE